MAKSQQPVVMDKLSSSAIGSTIGTHGACHPIFRIGLWKATWLTNSSMTS